MKIGILGEGFENWGGGIDFLRIISESIVYADPSVELHFLFSKSEPHYRLKKIFHFFKATLFKAGGRSYKRSIPLDQMHLIDLVNSIDGNVYIHFIDFEMSSLRKVVKKNKIDVLLPAIKPLKGQNVPWIGYLHDYQHAYIPELFSKKEISARCKHFNLMLKEAKHVIINARSVEEDIKRFNPEYKSKIITLPFSASPNKKWFEITPVDLTTFGIAYPYFIMCNQFWQHKDHLTGWKAFAELLEKFPNVELVCTGEPFDHRNPNYFSTLMNQAENLKIKPRLKILGLISKEDQISLLRQSIALIQPTLFEGGPGGGAVFDAVSLGIRSIVSDIPVNRELNESGVVFFEAGNHFSLAKCMLKEVVNFEEYEEDSSKSLMAAGKKRRVLCGRLLLNEISHTLGT